MKRYKDYMDGVEVSDTLHEKLKHLEEPKKRPAAWKKYGAAAAALILVAGVGAYGLSRGGWDALMENFRPLADTAAPEIADVGEPDIAFENPDMPALEPGQTPGREPFYSYGYELVEEGEGPERTVSYYFLPYLNWADTSQGMEMDYALAPPSAIYRGAALDDVLAFTGGEKAMADHLLWDGLDWGGLFWFLEDGTPCAAALYADGDGVSLSLEALKGGKVPSCIVLPDESYEANEWRGVEITALKNGSYMVVTVGAELHEHREVSFFCGGVGYKLTLYTDDVYQADVMCARFVRYAVDGGFRLDALSNHGAVDHSGFSVGEPNWGDGETGEFVPDYDPAYEDGVSDEDSGIADFYCDCPDCINGTVHTHTCDPIVPN